MENSLILGGTGTTGRRIVARLRAAEYPVRVAARTGGDLRVDLDDRSTWAAAVAGAGAAYVLEPSMPVDPAGRARIPAFVAEAVAAGVRRLVLLSAPGADSPEHPMYDAERSVRDSGAQWTILRPGWFAQNFSEGFWRPAVLAGALALPTGAGRTPFVDAEDIADLATAALTDPRHAGRTYLLTGPRALSFGEATALISAATGRTVRLLDIDPAVLVERQIAAGVPAARARILIGLLTALRDGPGDAVCDDIPQALDRPARSFEDFVRAAAAAGHWNESGRPATDLSAASR
jgi:uncharacterized protein YbjT (DUF2867 family)